MKHKFWHFCFMKLAPGQSLSTCSYWDLQNSLWSFVLLAHFANFDKIIHNRSKQTTTLCNGLKQSLTLCLSIFLTAEFKRGIYSVLPLFYIFYYLPSSGFFFLCQDCWHCDMPPQLAQPCCVFLGRLWFGAYQGFVICTLCLCLVHGYLLLCAETKQYGLLLVCHPYSSLCRDFNSGLSTQNGFKLKL